jgi:GNAT superfamily N-acetyltransferase
MTSEGRDASHYIVLKSMITLEPVSEENLRTFRTVRLSALEESPGAFGSTYAREIRFTQDEWLARAARWNGDLGIGYLAMEDGSGCGIAGGLLDANDPTRVQLVSMWTAHTHRQRGVGRLLVNAVIDWARLRGARTMQLMVTSGNESAIEFYGRLGFTKTGHTEPYPNDPALFEYEMIRPI